MTPLGGPGFGLGLPLRPLRDKWGWFVGFGAAAAALGALALGLSATATIASVLTIGVFMVLIGVSEIFIGFRARGWGQALYWEVGGVLYVLAGLFAIDDPVPASVVITLLLGAALLATGAVRAWFAFRMHDTPTRTPLMVSGVVTALLGAVIVLGWPGNSLLILGMLLGIDLLFVGIGWVVLGLRLRAA